MATPLLNRFGRWLGVWRGPVEFTDGRAGIMQFVLTSVFNGEAIQVDTVAQDSESGQPLTRGWGYLSLDRSGRIVNNIYSSTFGFAVLHETPDDPEVLSLQGAVAGNEVMDVTMSVDGDDFKLSSQRKVGYSGHDDRPRNYVTMKRMGRTFGENQ